MSQCVSPLDHPVLAGHLWATTGSPGCDCYSISSINQWFLYGHYYSKDGGRLMRNTLVKIRNSVSFWKGKCYTHYNKSGHYYIYQTPGRSDRMCLIFKCGSITQLTTPGCEREIYPVKLRIALFRTQLVLVCRSDKQRLPQGLFIIILLETL